MTTARLPCAVLAVLWLFLPGMANGQRIQFPSPVPPESVPAASLVPPGSVYGSGPTTSIAPAPAGGAIVATPSDMAPGVLPGATSAPSYLAPGSVYGPSAAPLYPPIVPPAYTPSIAPGPSATFQGGIQPPPTWDPYASPGMQQPGILPQDPALVGGGPAFPQDTMSNALRLLQQVDLSYVWMPGGSDPSDLGVQEFLTTATFAFPFFYNQQTPLLVTPGFGLHFFEGPAVAGADMPPVTFDAFLDFAWNPQFTPLLGAELGFRTGVYSDFEKVNTDSLRFLGRGLVTFSFTPSLKVKAGVLYLDRVRVQLLPAGGVVWTPANKPDLRFELLFPNPKIAMRMTTYRNTDWWAYLRGEYGGGSWTIERVSGAADQVDYNDVRIALGLEWDRYGLSHGFFEAGLSFERELVYDSGGTFEPDPTLFLGAGIAF